jgi:hypothetical protein
MILMLFRSSQCPLQNKKKISKIGLVDQEIITKNYFFEEWMAFKFGIYVSSKKIVYGDYFMIY